MQRFTTKIVNTMKQENLFASQGGPIIFSQVQLSKKTQLIYFFFFSPLKISIFFMEFKGTEYLNYVDRK